MYLTIRQLVETDPKSVFFGRSVCHVKVLDGSHVERCFRAALWWLIRSNSSAALKVETNAFFTELARLLPSVSSLSVTRPKAQSVAWIAAGAHLEELALSRCGGVRDWETLGSLHNLRSLVIHNVLPVAIGWVPNPAGLESLHASVDFWTRGTELDVSALTGLRSLAVNINGAALLGLECCTNLEWIQLWSCGAPVLDAAQLRLSRLRHLDVAGTTISDVSWIAKCPSLETLNAPCYRITAFPASRGSLTLLREAHLSHTKVTELGWLQDCRSLEVLGIRGCAALQTFECLCSFGGLTKLDISKCSIKDLAAIAEMASLKWLSLESCTAVRSFHSLAKLSSLTYLNLSNTAVNEVSWLTHCASLEALVMEGCEEVAHMPPLAALDHLKAVRVTKSAITTLSWLNGCNKLLSIDVSGSSSMDPHSTVHSPPPCLTIIFMVGCPVVDVSWLARCHNLETVNIGTTGVTSLQWATGLQKLASIGITEAKVSDIPCLGHCKALRTIESNGAQEEDLVALLPGVELNYLRWRDL